MNEKSDHKKLLFSDSSPRFTVEPRKKEHSYRISSIRPPGRLFNFGPSRGGRLNGEEAY